MAANPQKAFRNALARIGFNVATRTAIAENGFETILDLATVQEEDLDKLPKHLEAWRDPAAAPNLQVRVPFVSLKKLKAMRYWVLAQRCVGVANPRAQDFTDAVLEETLARMKADKDYKLATEETDIPKPEKLTDLAKWTKFWELLSTFLGRVKGAALIPLSYLVREHQEVTAEILNADYDSIQDHLIATTALSGTHFDMDNRTLYDEFKPLVVDGPGWSFVKKFDKQKDGRGAVLALKTQAEGTSAKITRKQAAYASITSSAYHGPRKGFSFANYVTLHQAAHNELLDLDEPVAETKKVSDFLKGIRDPNLTIAKNVVLGDPIKLDDFEECQQYISTIVSNLANQQKAERHVAAVYNDGSGGGGSGSLFNKIKGGNYTDEQFRSLTPDEKKKVHKLREEAKKKKKDKRNERRKRKAARLKSERESVSGDDGETGEATSNAGAQFGSNGNRSKKNKN
jgi:hypothetical protein